MDRSTGLIRFGARDYDPSVGRWTCKDAAGLAGMDLGEYTYALASPLNYRDVTGADSEPIAVPQEGVLDYVEYSVSVHNAVRDEAARRTDWRSSRERDDFMHSVAACLITRKYGAAAGWLAAVLQEGNSTITYGGSVVVSVRASKPLPSLRAFLKDTRDDLKADGAGIRRAAVPRRGGR
jgi:RHS repeat-associated protein